MSFAKLPFRLGAATMFFAEFNEISSKVIPKDEPPQRCCIYKDRAVIAERIRLAIGGSRKASGVVQVIDIACDECPEAGYVVTDLCRGCLAHGCIDACKLGPLRLILSIMPISTRTSACTAADVPQPANIVRYITFRDRVKMPARSRQSPWVLAVRHP